MVNTSDENWLDNFKNLLKDHKFNCLFDSLGGGPIASTIVKNLLPQSKCYVYGALEGKPMDIDVKTLQLGGIVVEGFLLFTWWATVSKEVN